MTAMKRPPLPKMLVRGLFRRCAWCGGRGAFFTGWTKKQSHCATCGLKWRRGDVGYELGADGNGRDVMVRLLYGGRNSLLIGIGAALVTTILAIGFGLLGGYLRGWTDGVIARLMDILWAFPVILLGVALGTALALGGFKAGPVTIESGSLLIPMFVITSSILFPKMY